MLLHVLVNDRIMHLFSTYLLPGKYWNLFRIYPSAVHYARAEVIFIYIRTDTHTNVYVTILRQTLTLRNSDIIPARVFFKPKNDGAMRVPFAPGCKPSAEEPAKYHSLPVPQATSHRICAPKAQLPTVRHPEMANPTAKLVYEHQIYSIPLYIINTAIDNKRKDVTFVSTFP